MRRAMPRAIAIPSLVAAAIVLTAATARAGDPFEIQVYDGTANPPGVPGIELHLNDWATGNRDATPPEAPLHGQFHATLEPSFGVTPFWELGAYVQSALRTDIGVFDWAGVKLRSKFVTPPSFDAHWRLGVNFEVSYLPATYDHDRWGSEVRPIVAWYDPNWLFAFNPILDQSLAGSDASQGPSFQPALKASRTVGPVGLGIEYYATLGPFSGFLPWSQQQQQVFECVDVLSIEHVELNACVGEGLTSSSEGVVLKTILGYSFETAPATQAARAASNWRRTP